MYKFEQKTGVVIALLSTLEAFVGMIRAGARPPSYQLGTLNKDHLVALMTLALRINEGLNVDPEAYSKPEDLDKLLVAEGIPDIAADAATIILSDMNVLFKRAPAVLTTAFKGNELKTLFNCS